MFNSYFLRYRVRLDGQDSFHTMEVSGHYRNNAQVREEFEWFCPISFQDKKAQERLRFKLLSVKENIQGPYYDS
jgi:hypothetical protein